MEKKEKSILQKAVEKVREKKSAELAAEIIADFEDRRERKRYLELNWQLNMNFVKGNQYCGVSAKGEIEDNQNDYFWQQKEVFNHIAPILETRLAKLGRVRPVMKIAPFSSDDDDLYAAKMSTAIIKAASARLELDSIIAKATMWSEVTGSVFYKVIWNPDAGIQAFEQIREGDVEISVCPPFEIFPDNLAAADLDACNSIIHARSVSSSDVKEIWGVEVCSSNHDVLNFESITLSGGAGYSTVTPKFNTSSKEGQCIVIERYTRPSKQYKNGRLEIVAGDVLVFEGDLPYINGKDGVRDFPFVRQVAIECAGSFFGTSVVERAIPIQRAFNALKNRKHEFINRLAMGVLAVEDGSIDTDNLEDEGLCPGKILVYRQGATPPMMMDMGRVPSELAYEEDRLLNEFIAVTGVSEIMRNSQVPSSISSGVALQLLIEQDDTRLSVSAEIIRNAVRSVSQHVLRLYKQFALTKRLSRIAGENGIEVVYWTKNDISGDDIVFVTENELNETPASRRNMVFELLKAGLLHDENGRLSNTMRAKALDLLGYGLWEDAQDTASLHIKRAALENTELKTAQMPVRKIDDHEIHIKEHTRFMLSADFDENANYYEHIAQHEAMLLSSQQNAPIEEQAI